MNRREPRTAEWTGPETSDAHDAIERHVRRFFADRETLVGGRITASVLTNGPQRLPSSFRVLEVPPQKASRVWHYVSVGAFAMRADHEDRLEFVLRTDSRERPRAVELLSMLAYYHSTEGLGVGHMLPIGEPWLPQSQCDAMLISLPYPLGPQFEVCPIDEQRHVHIYWALPITSAERAFARAHGLEELEQRLESAGIIAEDPRRGSVISN